MRKFLHLLSAWIALASQALCADLDARFNGASRSESPWNWTGCHVGGEAGAFRSSEQWTNRTPGGDFNNESLGGHDLQSWAGGAQAGCDYQFPSGLLVGVMGDYDWANADGSHASARETGVTYGNRTTSLASVTGRIGYGWGRFLGYVKGGIAWEGDDYAASTTLVGTAYAAHVTREGWTVGVGGAYAWTRFLSSYVEYDYDDFGTGRVAFTPQLTGLRPAFVDIRQTTGIVHVGFDLRFGR
jgi:outer membrane immunogenic protein